MDELLEDSLEKLKEFSGLMQKHMTKKKAKEKETIEEKMKKTPCSFKFT